MTRKTKPPVMLYSALADATRCRIVEILVAGPVPVHRLADAFPVSRPAISRHLRVLKTAGLVVEVKKGRENLYSLRADKLDKAAAWIETLSRIAPAAEPQAAVTSTPTPARPTPAEVMPPTTAPDIAATPQRPAEKPLRLPRKPAETKPADPVNQMGFDF